MAKDKTYLSSGHCATQRRPSFGPRQTRHPVSLRFTQPPRHSSWHLIFPGEYLAIQCTHPAIVSVQCALGSCIGVLCGGYGQQFPGGTCEVVSRMKSLTAHITPAVRLSAAMAYIRFVAFEWFVRFVETIEIKWYVRPMCYVGPGNLR